MLIDWQNKFVKDLRKISFQILRTRVYFFSSLTKLFCHFIDFPKSMQTPYLSAFSAACRNKTTANEPHDIIKLALSWKMLAIPLSRSHCRQTGKEICQKKIVHSCTQSNHLSQKICQRKFARVQGSVRASPRRIAFTLWWIKINEFNFTFLVCRNFERQINSIFLCLSQLIFKVLQG